MQVPSIPMTGKGAKVSLSFNDGAAVSSFALTKQASYNYSGEIYTNRAYFLGTGRMINSRPAANPTVFVNGILDGIDVSSTVSNEIATSAGSILVSNLVVPVPADTSVAIVRPASTQARWTAISVNTGTGAVTATAGTDTSAGTGKAGLLATYGSSAGQKPLIAVDELLVCYLSLDSTAGLIASNEIMTEDREWSAISYRMVPSVGGIIISSALPALHTGNLPAPYISPESIGKVQLLQLLAMLTLGV